MDTTYSAADLAERYGISEYQVNERCRRGEWPHLRVGRARRFTAAQIEEIDARHSVKVADDKAAAQSWGRKKRGAA